MRREHRRASAVVAGAAVVSLVLTACASDGASGPHRGSSSASLHAAGPWADEFREALDHGVSAYEAAVLDDGQVTVAELEDAHDRVSRCLADSGYGIEYDPDGGFDLTALDGRYPDDFFERSDPVLRACEERYDEYVTMLFEETRRNPEKQDEAKITVACLRRAGLVGKDYTERKWRTEGDAGVFSFDEYAPAAVQCRLDPLGVWREP
ncbi:hypothetical protein [Curtobacterium sp. MCBD17_032]|uniref:hypothetical protein n=1 Tax=Curtobacterium sp. MCBD17_032 TaxID=2175659 RepID=UPI000DA8D340|nr:hypothetical protein [Curtobacterium sp. MCBD17_032]PZE86312.1 hypothetical protein DEI91_04230 [Curtobacterium sp. MCBD17_032]